MSDSNEPKQPRNMAASVNHRLLNLARERGEDFSLLLTRYALERLLYRLAQSGYANQFILKGALLFSLWGDHPHRTTRDLDLLGSGSPEPARIEMIFRELCLAPVEEDGLAFLADSVRSTLMREDQEYNGLRINAVALLGRARIPLQIDIGFGDAVTPAPAEADFPSLLHFTSPRIRIYPRETVVAEKFQAMVMLGIANSRMKDFYDVWTLLQQFPFNGSILSRAIQATFARRSTALPEQTPLALTGEFAADTGKQRQWDAFIRKGKLTPMTPALEEVLDALHHFLMPPTLALSQGDDFDQLWLPRGPWQPRGTT